MGDGRVDPASDNDTVEEVGPKLASLGDGAGHDGGGGGGEHKLGGGLQVQSFDFPLTYLEEPLGILVVFQLVVEVLRPTTEQVAIWRKDGETSL